MYSISVYITSFNKNKYLPEAITSVLNQSLRPEEIIIVDDGSTDDSKEIIKGFSSRYPEIITPIFNERNLGISNTRNLALKQCNGNIVTFLDGDDIFYSNKLKLEYEKLTSNTQISAVYSNFNYISDEGDAIGKFSENSDLPAEGNIFINTVMRDYNVSSTNNYIYEMFYKSCAENNGYYDENIKLWEDWDFRIRMSKVYQYGYCNQINSAYRKLPDGLHNSNYKLHYREQIKIYNKNKFLLDDLQEDEKTFIYNRFYTKIKKLFINIIKDNRNIFINILYSMHFIFSFTRRKSISVVYRTLFKE